MNQNRQLTIEIVNDILESLDSDRTARLSECGNWVEVVTSGFYEDEPNGEKEGDIVATFRVYKHDFGLHHALFNVIQCNACFTALAVYMRECVENGTVWLPFRFLPALLFKEKYLTEHGYQITDFPWTEKIEAGQKEPESDE